MRLSDYQRLSESDDPYAEVYPDIDFSDLTTRPIDHGFEIERLQAQVGTTQAAPVVPGSGGAQQPSAAPRTQRVTEAQRYGDVSNEGFSIAAVDQVVLARPSTKRIFLEIQNTHATGVLYLAYGAPASALNGIQIQPAETYTRTQFVPQNDVHLNSSVAGTTGVIAYANKGEEE